MLFFLYNDISGLERAARLFPFRTGVAAPDWVVLDERADSFGAAGVVAAGLAFCQNSIQSINLVSASGQMTGRLISP